MGSMLAFAVPMILGNLLQQCYNVADTLIVGRYLGKNALAAVGSSFTLMTFLTSILLGLCMGSGAVFSIRFGRLLLHHPRDPGLRPHRRLHPGAERSRVPLPGRHPGVPPGARRGVAHDAGVPGRHLLRHRGHLPL